MGKSKWLSITQSCWWDTCTPCPLQWLVHSCSFLLEEGLWVPQSFLWLCRSWIQDSLHDVVFRQAWKAERTHEVSSYDLRVEWDYAKYVTGFVGNGLIYFFIPWTPLQNWELTFSSLSQGWDAACWSHIPRGSNWSPYSGSQTNFLTVFSQAGADIQGSLSTEELSLQYLQFPHLLNMSMLP